MIKIDEQPVDRRMTGIARRAILSFVRIIIRMTVNARRRDTLIIAIDMAR
jgi:hypothetical protein